MFRSRDERKVREAGIDPARLPPGQHLTVKWPVLHAGGPPDVDLATWTPPRLRRGRGGGQPSTGSSSTRCRARATSRTSTGHPLEQFDTAFEGVHWRELAEALPPAAVGPLRPRLGRARLHCQRAAASLEDPLALLATHGDGEPLTLDHGYPLRLVVPHKYFWKSAKWLRGIELLAEDQLGFWERYGYPNDADPFQEERYSF